MIILPIKSIREEDRSLVGGNLVNLAKLYQHNLGVAQGIVLLPPEDFQHQIKPPEQLKKVIKEKDLKKLWINLVKTWTTNPSAQLFFFTNKIEAYGEAFYDHVLKQANIKVNSGQLTPWQISQIEEIIKLGNQKLFIPQVYYFIDDGQIRIIKLAPFTQLPELPLSKDQQSANLTSFQKPANQLAVKILMDLSDEPSFFTGLDGVIIKGGRITDQERQITKLCQTATNFPNLPIIYQFSQASLLKDEAKTFLFARNKKRLLNCQLAIPKVCSAEEFLQLKRDLASLGLSRKATLKMWLQLSVPENIINLEDYLIAGFDGAMINLDEMAMMLTGANPQTSSLVKFLEDSIRVLNRAAVPIIFRGDLALDDEVLKLVFERGIWAVAITPSHAPGIHHQLGFALEHHFKHQNYLEPE